MLSKIRATLSANVGRVKPAGVSIYAAVQAAFALPTAEFRHRGIAASTGGFSGSRV
jgi:hypothetical protein